MATKETHPTPGIARPEPSMTEQGGERTAAHETGPQLPELVGAYLARSLPPAGPTPAVVRVRQSGEMWKSPGARAMRFEATEEFRCDRVSFCWRARFPILGPVAMRVVDGFDGGTGRLRVSLLGLPLQQQAGRETDVGEAMRYLAELAWAPQAIAANRELEWRTAGERAVEVVYDAGVTARVRWEFDDAGDPVRMTGTRPFPTGKGFVELPWGGDFRDFRDFSGTRAPTVGEAWWQRPEGRFVYWRGRIETLELLEA